MVKRFTEPAPSVRAVRPNVPESVDQAIRKALAPVPADRFATMSQFGQALQADGEDGARRAHRDRPDDTAAHRPPRLRRALPRGPFRRPATPHPGAAAACWSAS